MVNLWPVTRNRYVYNNWPVFINQSNYTLWPANPSHTINNPALNSLTARILYPITAKTLFEVSLIVLLDLPDRLRKKFTNGTLCKVMSLLIFFFFFTFIPGTLIRKTLARQKKTAPFEGVLLAYPSLYAPRKTY